MSEPNRTPSRPLPSLDEPDTGEFWRKTRDKVLGYQHCDDCGTIVFYPRRHCTGCLGSNLTWQASAGEGTIYTFSVVRQSYHPFFRSLVPYAVAWNITGVDDPGTLEVGQRVTVTWEEHDELCIPLFRPARE